MAIVRAVYGPEPNRQGEFPVAHIVGFDGVTQIIEQQDNLGDYGISWFCVFKGDFESTRLNARHVAQVEFMKMEASDDLPF